VGSIGPISFLEAVIWKRVVFDFPILPLLFHLKDPVDTLFISTEVSNVPRAFSRFDERNFYPSLFLLFPVSRQIFGAPSNSPSPPAFEGRARSL